MKKLFLFTFLFIVSTLFLGCVLEDESAEDNATATGSDFSADETVYINLTDKTYSLDGSSYSADSLTTTEVSIFDNTVYLSYDESTGLLVVDATDASKKIGVSLSGTLSTGGVKIQTNNEDEIGLYLNSVTITSSNYPCVDITKGSAASVFVEGENTFTDGREYGYGYGDSYSTSSNPKTEDGSDSKGTLVCKGGISLSGSGSLTVKQAYKNCIASKAGYLEIESGTYTLFNYTYDSTEPLSKYSSIQSSGVGKNGAFGAQGVIVAGGAVSFYGCGIVSSSDIRKANGFKTDDDDYSSSYVTISGGTVNVVTYNGKGITAPYVNITGGTNTFTVEGSTTYAEAGDNPKTVSGYDADGCSATITLKFAPEGVEGSNEVNVSGGTTEITATDDAINASESSGKVSISAGNLYVHSTGGDGVDSNGDIYISGGNVVSYAPNGSEDAYDCGDSNKIYLTGGVIAGTCGSSNGISSFSTSEQKVLYFKGSSQSGSRAAPNSSSASSSFFAVAVKMSGSTKYAYSLPSSSWGLFVMSCSDFTSSSSSGYTVYTNPTISNYDFNGLCTSSTTLDSVVGSSTKTPSIK